jgi:hypothetical protein
MASDFDPDREANETASEEPREGPQAAADESVKTQKMEPPTERSTKIEEPEKQTVLDKLRGAYARARDGRNRVAATASQARNAKTKDRSKTLLVLALSVVLMLFAFVAMFSHSTRGNETDDAEPRKAGGSREYSRNEPRVRNTVAKRRHK